MEEPSTEPLFSVHVPEVILRRLEGKSLELGFAKFKNLCLLAFSAYKQTIQFGDVDSKRVIQISFDDNILLEKLEALLMDFCKELINECDLPSEEWPIFFVNIGAYLAVSETRPHNTLLGLKVIRFTYIGEVIDSDGMAFEGIFDHSIRVIPVLPSYESGTSLIGYSLALGYTDEYFD